jgi:hypothetical protein
LVDVTAKVRNVPAATAAVTFTCTHELRLTAPIDATAGPSMLGFVFHVTVVSDHVVFELVATEPPAGLGALLVSATCSRRRAWVIGPVTPRRSNRANVRIVGEASTTSCVLVPSRVVGADALTDASATGRNVTVAAWAPVPIPAIAATPTVAATNATTARRRDLPPARTRPILPRPSPDVVAYSVGTFRAHPELQLRIGLV